MFYHCKFLSNCRRTFLKSPRQPQKATKKNKQSNFRISSSRCRISFLETHADENSAITHIWVSIPMGINSRGSSVRVLQDCSLVIYMTFLSKVTIKNVMWLMHLKLSTQSLKTDPPGNVFCESLKRKAVKQCKISVAAMIHSVWLKKCRTCCATVGRQQLWYGNAKILQSIFLKQFSGRFWAPKWVRIWSPLRLF